MGGGRLPRGRSGRQRDGRPHERHAPLWHEPDHQHDERRIIRQFCVKAYHFPLRSSSHRASGTAALPRRTESPSGNALPSRPRAQVREGRGDFETGPFVLPAGKTKSNCQLAKQNRFWLWHDASTPAPKGARGELKTQMKLQRRPFRKNCSQKKIPSECLTLNCSPVCNFRSGLSFLPSSLS